MEPETIKLIGEIMVAIGAAGTFIAVGMIWQHFREARWPSHHR